ncbi:hypothetical protein MDAP_000159 [Mitosporidium daphniae]|uniref:Yeast cell wall synthesis Kre9/Knh1-like N-terminal domain-containing protein n=1 Tax=Mitosporidium daphniae TaxID=1485682 RepID=A0A098VWF2_9MICR|nr:uncharacterized protein DI09_103p100 [Mitosporidium daphniae]KGG53214.1 hypothetical protein DI09_103p100 [Mitosporidium daphniae]|eukprot:XP_013239641.1 uncharacterized protein DI09_103p100 [Mitosporidium daphniae]
MMILSTLLSFLAFFTAINCDFSHLYIKEPNQGISWRPGSNVAIKWTNIGGELHPNALISIDIMDGDAQSADLIAHVGSNIPASANEYNWIVPVNMEQRSDYFVRMSSTDPSGVSYFYSGRYSVAGEAMGATLVSQPWEHEISSTAKPKPTNVVVPTTAHDASTAHVTETVEDKTTSLMPTRTSNVISTAASSIISEKETMATSSVKPQSSTQRSESTTSSEEDKSSANLPVLSSWVLISSATIFLSVFLIGVAV